MPRGRPRKQAMGEQSQIAVARTKRKYTIRNPRRNADYWVSEIQKLQDALADACAAKVQLMSQLEQLQDHTVPLEAVVGLQGAKSEQRVLVGSTNGY